MVENRQKGITKAYRNDKKDFDPSLRRRPPPPPSSSARVLVGGAGRVAVGSCLEIRSELVASLGCPIDAIEPGIEEDGAVGMRAKLALRRSKTHRIASHRIDWRCGAGWLARQGAKIYRPLAARSPLGELARNSAPDGRTTSARRAIVATHPGGGGMTSTGDGRDRSSREEWATIILPPPTPPPSRSPRRPPVPTEGGGST